MSKATPDHHDADLLLKVYDLRREAVLREARKAIQREFWPAQWEDLQAVLRGDHPLNAAYRQVGTYWEMVYSFARFGIVHPGFWLESNAEGMFLYVKVEPLLAKLREAGQPTAFRNAEWVAKECEGGPALHERIKARVAQMAAARK